MNDIAKRKTRLEKNVAGWKDTFAPAAKAFSETKSVLTKEAGWETRYAAPQRTP